MDRKRPHLCLVTDAERMLDEQFLGVEGLLDELQEVGRELGWLLKYLPDLVDPELVSRDEAIKRQYKELHPSLPPWTVVYADGTVEVEGETEPEPEAPPEGLRDIPEVQQWMAEQASRALQAEVLSFERKKSEGGDDERVEGDDDDDKFDEWHYYQEDMGW